MKKVVVIVSLVVAAVVAISYLPHLRAALAAPLPQLQQTPPEGKGCAAPRSWGELKSISDRAIAFEDSSGTIRVLDAGPCMRGETQLVVKITRQ